jgi:NAD(P)-dependent dehydrogenase (short-subunit alcohol dehydrogenase family)
MYAEKFRLDGKVAIVTGGSRGIGKAIAIGLAEQGARLALASRKLEALDRVAEEIRQKGGECLATACHMGKPDQIKNLFDKVVEIYGTVDILVNNAATNPYFGFFLDATEEAWDKTLEVNLKGPFLMTQAAARIMMQKGGGSIINVSSVGAFKANPMQGIYGVTKAGMVNMTKTFAQELALANVRVNAICPGLTETKFSEVLIQTKEIYDIALEKIPMKRHAQPSEIVGAALYLASDASSYVTGTCITIDGGMMT